VPSAELTTKAWRRRASSTTAEGVRPGRSTAPEWSTLPSTPSMVYEETCSDSAATTCTKHGSQAAGRSPTAQPILFGVPRSA
jgi:hypothetical protein